MIPRIPIILTFAGLIPFVFGALTTLGIVPFFMGYGGPFFLISYATVILCFMAGVLWGMCVNADPAKAARGTALSVLPALWLVFFPGSGPTSAAINLMTGFVSVLLIDVQFARWGLTPTWWIKIRSIVTVCVLLCLLPLMTL